MIIYFSGTGNSAYVAKKIAAATGDSSVNIGERIKAGDHRALAVNGKLTVVTPTYAWRMPHIVTQWLGNTPLQGVSGVWFVLTCGGEMGNAAKYNRLLCEKKGLQYMGSAQIVMPENYLAMFSVPSEEEAEKIVAQAEPSIRKCAQQIAVGQRFSVPRNNLYDRYMSKLVNPLFYTLYVKSEPFTVDDSCVGCGKCVALCPLNNIKTVEGKPVYGKQCTHCMACIAHCPAEAINYGKKTRKKHRYHLD